MAALEISKATRRIASTYPSLVLFQLARFFLVLATEMQAVAVGWQVYEITKRPLDLGLVGLAQFLPGIFLFLVSGHAADRYPRRNLLVLCYCGFTLCSGSLLFLTLRGVHSVYPIFAVTVLLGVVRSFNGPVSRAFLPQLVSGKDFQTAVAWYSIFIQSAVILGPSLGGLVYAAFRGPAAVYTLSFIAAALGAMSTVAIKAQSNPRLGEPMSWKTMLAGFHYIRSERLILGSISLDLFAVLLGGAVALLPVYAREILKTGPWGLGILRSAPAAGAATMAALIAHKPLGHRTGSTMLWCVAGFGAATIVFGLSRSLTISLIALLLVGATDMVSVIVRQLFIQVSTPDEMRGRVNAVDMIFVGASNELGQFESGLTAHWFGVVPAVVLGGLGTLAVTALWAWYFPELRKTEKLHSPAP